MSVDPAEVETKLKAAQDSITSLTAQIEAAETAADAALREEFGVTAEAGEVTAEMPAAPAEDDSDAFDKAMAAKEAAVDCMEQGNFEGALAKYLEALQGERQPMLLANVANCYVKLKQPSNAFLFLDAALEMNPDSAKAHKIYSQAAKSIGKWETALNHAQLALKIDFDEATYELEKAVNSKFAEIKALKSQLGNAEKDLEFAEKLSKQAALHEQRKKEKEAEAAEAAMGGMGGMPGGGPGGMPADFMSDPDIQAAMSNPKVLAALQEIMTNPAAMAKYQNDPEVMGAFTKLQSKFGGMGGGGMPGGMPGGFAGGMPGGFDGGMPGGMPGADAGPPPDDDVVEDID